MATLASLAKPTTKPLLVQPGGAPGAAATAGDDMYRALATGNQAGLAGAGSASTNAGINNTFYQQGVANPWYQSHQVELNRQGPMFQPGGMFYNPAVDGASGAGAGTLPPGGAASGGGMTAQGGAATAGAGGGSAVPTSAGGAPDWSKLDVSKFLDPNLAFSMKQGTDAIANSAAAKGGLLSGNTMKGLADYTTGMANRAYGQAQDAAFHDRDFMRGAYTNDRDYDTALGQWNSNFAENKYRYGNDFNESARRYGQDFNESQRRYGNDFNESQRRYGNDFGESARRYDTGVDERDRDFMYNAGRDDRNFNYTSLRDLSQMGLSATQGNGGLMEQLSRLLSGNTMLGAGAGAAGTTGGANAINNMLSQLFRYYGG